MVVNLDFDTILIWLLVGLVAGFFASHIALGHGLGIVGDVVVGIIGAFLGGFLANAFHWAIVIAAQVRVAPINGHAVRDVPQRADNPAHDPADKRQHGEVAPPG